MQISSRAVMFWGCRWATRTFNSLQRFSMGLRSGDWLGHSRTLTCFLRSHSFVARAVCLGSLSCWKTQPRFIFNALADGRRFSLKISRYMAPFILSFTQISRPGPFAEKQPQSMMFPPPCFTVGMVFFGCNSAFFLLQTRQVEFLPKSSILVSSDHMTFSQSSSGSSKCSLANFRWAWTCTGLSRGTRLALQDLSPWRRSVLLMVAFVTLVPALCRSFTRSPRVVLGFLLTVLVIILTPRGEILRGAPDRGRLSVVLYVFHFLIITPTVDFFTPSCLPIADSVFPAWCRSTILFLVSFDSSLVLAIVEFGVWLFEVVDRCLYTDNEFKQIPLIQVTSGGQRSLLKKKLQVCESQQSCLFVGDQILIFHHNLQINSLKILMWFSGFFFLILSLIVEVYLWWKLQASLIF